MNILDKWEVEYKRITKNEVMPQFNFKIEEFVERSDNIMVLRIRFYKQTRQNLVQEIVDTRLIK